MKKYFITFILICSAQFFAMAQSKDFFQSQLKYPRVKSAFDLKNQYLNDLLVRYQINPNNYNIYLRAFKAEQKLEVWAKNIENESYKLIKIYDFCATSGKLGPKRRSGDRQIPEGFYWVDFFNPESNYLLSFRLNYPNSSDLFFADKVNPGDNIFIHGQCVTIGCIPIGDEAIQELYLLVSKAHSFQQGVPVHIFPNKMNQSNYSKLHEEFQNEEDLLLFWSWLKPVFDYFERNKQLPIIKIDESGKYLIQP